MIVIINPNSTVSMTDAMLATARAAAPDAIIEGWTSHGGPAAIEGPADGEASVPALLTLVQKASDQGADAIIIGCFDDTGLDAARKIATCPVIGIGQAAYHVAALAGPRFSVVTTLAVSIPTLAENIRSYGLESQVAQIRASDVPVLALEDESEIARRKVMDEVARAAAQDNVQSIILGCAGMVDLHDVRIPGPPILLIDGVRAATKICSLY